ncbi:MAG: hypothetical protein JWL72_2769 [Ilumatobacteraceae bacterium]|nr:hypothetical protein [Ilumatobacteraceae bacterium]
MYAPNAAGHAAAARVRVHAGVAQLTLGYGWQSVMSPCDDSVSTNVAFMAITGNKRQPRRLGQRST